MLSPLKKMQVRPKWLENYSMRQFFFRIIVVLEIPITFIMFICQGEEHHLLKCFRCSSTLGSVHVTVEDSSLHMLDTRDAFSIHLYKHGISLRSSNLFRYGLFNSNAMY